VSMWKTILDTTTSVLRLAQDVRQNREEIKEIRKEHHETVSAVERLKLQVEQMDEREERERQFLLLQMENLLLRNRELLALPEPDAPMIGAGPRGGS
jgi:deoxycytidine triphosphate deaminase